MLCKSTSKGSGLASSDQAALTVSRARALLSAGFQALEDRKQEINDLNVYPVPDGDTGTNLALTLKGILDAFARLPEDLSGRALCDAVSQAALMGARGNSGVILSQIIRGAMEILGPKQAITGETITAAMRHATETAYRAVRKPVEGTMLTVLREMAEAAEADPDPGDIRGLMERAVLAGWRSVEKTPTLLKVLADAGVVDAGGYGLVVLVEGAASGGAAWETPIATRAAQPIPMGGDMYADEEEPESLYTYCTSFLLTGGQLGKDGLEEQLARLGDSLLVVGDSGQLKVHVHTDDPGQVLAVGTSMGVLSEIEIDNMKIQTSERGMRLARTGQATPVEPGLTQVVAVVAGEGNKRLFRDLGVDFLVDGGQSMNPSAEDLMRAVEKASAPSVIILPNNSNVIMTAEQTAKLTDKAVFVLPTRSMQAGLSAAVAFDRRIDGSENMDEMRSAIKNVATGEVTRAVRDSVVDGVQIKAGDYIGLIDEKVVVASRDLEPVVDEVAATLMSDGREVLTVLKGGDDPDGAAKAAEHLKQAHPAVEIDVYDGGQPFYPLLLSAE